MLSQSAIGSVAAAAEQAFIPYAERVLELLKIFMVLTNDEDLRSRARATELLGLVAESVGRARMEPILPPFVEAAISVTILTCCLTWNQNIPFCINDSSPLFLRVLDWNSVSLGSTPMDFLATLQGF